jgi:hypothetical protein
MIQWQIIGAAVVIALGVGYVVVHRQQLGFAGPHAIGTRDGRDAQSPKPDARPASIEWQKIEHGQDGFRVDMPEDIKQIQIPAYTETGGTQRLDLIYSNPDAETTFSAAWQNNPPVARVNRQIVDRTLEMARDGAIARTQTTLVNETRENTQGIPGRMFEARNSGGGVMNARLIYAGSHLYMLIASFPSVRARRDRDVTRFFDSFAITSQPGPISAGNGGARAC